MIAEKLHKLDLELRGYGSCLIAYSGGVDSVFLAMMAWKALGDRMLAVIADSPSLPRRELSEALEVARKFGFPVEVIRTAEFDNPSYLSNPSNRCYFCKQELFKELAPLAKRRGFAVLAYGENASDVGDYRPGAGAAAEAGARAPLKAVGLTKAEIRAASLELGLPTADKPEAPCLSSRIPYGEAVDPRKLAVIEAAEDHLRALGCREVRVRLHETGVGYLGRIELGAGELVQFVTRPDREEILRKLREAGLSIVTLDLAGYRRGSLNSGMNQTTEAVRFLGGKPGLG